MNALTDLLQIAQIKRALIVDDAFDSVPLASDLSLDNERWSQFFDDLNDDDLNQIRSAFPTYDNFSGDQLKFDNNFVEQLWSIKDRLRPEIAGPLFGQYESDTATDLNYLETLRQCLIQSGFECETAGRSFQGKGSNADLIVIDLFLGSTQDDSAISISISGLQGIISARPTRPPLIILMSRSSRLEDKRIEFRDKSGLFESMFRILRKTELRDNGKLTRTLTRLVSHYPDANKLACFLNAWRNGLASASDRTSKLIRTLDIPDYAQIQQLLLNAEGEPLGSYIVDVFDRVLQHEVEREKSIIDSAIEINALKIENYPPPYVAGSPDLQLLVFRSLFQNPERLRLSVSSDNPVGFGDLLRRKNALVGVAPLQVESRVAAEPITEPIADPAVPSTTPVPLATKTEAPRPLSNIDANSVLVILTPACDLQRSRANDLVLLVRGELKKLAPEDWSYKDAPIRTPIIDLGEHGRFWIKWNIKNLEAISSAALKALLGASDGFSIVARMRESNALELQQKMLANLGRVGLLASMPATFPIKVEVFLPGLDRKPLSLSGSLLPPITGVCFVGRDKGMQLVICEGDCELIFKAIQEIDLALIHSDAHPAITKLRTSEALLMILEREIGLPSSASTTLTEITAPLIHPGDTTPFTIGYICRSEALASRDLKTGEIQKAAIILGVSDVS